MLAPLFFELLIINFCHLLCKYVCIPFIILSKLTFLRSVVISLLNISCKLIPQYSTSAFLI